MAKSRRAQGRPEATVKCSRSVVGTQQSLRRGNLSATRSRGETLRRDAMRSILPLRSRGPPAPRSASPMATSAVSRRTTTGSRCAARGYLEADVSFGRIKDFWGGVTQYDPYCGKDGLGTFSTVRGGNRRRDGGCAWSATEPAFAWCNSLCPAQHRPRKARRSKLPRGGPGPLPGRLDAPTEPRFLAPGRPHMFNARP